MNDWALPYFIFCMIYVSVGALYFASKNNDWTILFLGFPSKKITKPQAIHMIGWFILMGIWILVFVFPDPPEEVVPILRYFLGVIVYGAIGVLYSVIKEESAFRMFTTLNWKKLSKPQAIYGTGLLALLAGWILIILK